MISKRDFLKNHLAGVFLIAFLHFKKFYIV